MHRDDGWNYPVGQCIEPDAFLALTLIKLVESVDDMRSSAIQMESVFLNTVTCSPNKLLQVVWPDTPSAPFLCRRRHHYHPRFHSLHDSTFLQGS
jgi:hypothetical protein